MSDAAPQQNSTPWHILGTGSMACLWGGALARAGHDVRMIGRHARAGLAYHALLCETAGKCARTVVRLESAAGAGSIVRLLVCTKAGDTLAALAPLCARIVPDAVVVLLQNGMGFQHELQSALPGRRIFCAVTTEGAWLRAPFHVVHAGRGSTQIGRFPRGDHAEAAGLAAELADSGFALEPRSDIETALWRKLAINCTINALAALHGCPNGGLLEDAARATEFEALCAETATVLAASGHVGIARTLFADATTVARATAGNRSSMLQDLEAGRRTEIDFINGQLCRAADSAGLPCPLNRALWQRVRERECARA